VWHLSLTRFRIVILATLSVTLITAMAGWGIHEVDGAVKGVIAAQEEARQRLLIVQALDNAHVHFKAEVQEWKNILLRGRRANDFLLHKNQFEYEAGLVTDLLLTVTNSLRAANLETKDADELMKAHLLLQQRYHETLTRFDVSRFDEAHRADLMIRGIDRATNERFDDVVGSVDRAARKRLDKLVTIAKAEANIAWWTVFDAAWAAIALAIGLALWVVRGIWTVIHPESR
jgi:methyl-accepting chemotaxis protein